MRFIITGSGRTGTTLLWKLFQAHSQVNIALEPFTSGLTDLSSYNAIKQPIQCNPKFSVGCSFKRNGSVLFDLSKVGTESFIVVQRDKADTVYSLVVRHEKAITRENIALAALQYDTIYAYINEFFAQNPDKRRFDIRYLELCDAPEPTVRAACDFVGIDFEAQMMNSWKDVPLPAWANSVSVYENNAIKRIAHHDESSYKRFMEIYTGV